MSLTRFPIEEVAEKLNEIIGSAIKTTKPILFLLSGGSCLPLLEKVNTENFSPQITIAPLDERYSADPKENNMAQIMTTDFYHRAAEKKVGIVDTRVRAGETQVELADRFNSTLNSWFSDNPDGIVVATAGIGPDGHTSGMMPFSEDPNKFTELFDGEDKTKLVTSYDATGKNPYPLRITTTMNLMRKINKAIVYAVGENKREALTRLMDPKANLATTPAAILKEIPGDVYLFTNLDF